MKSLVYSLKHEVSLVLGEDAESLEGECETTSCFTIAKLFPQQMHKVFGEFEGSGHFWTEVNGEIIDLSIEQFGYSFEFPVSKQRKAKYKSKRKTKVDSNIYKESKHLALISGFHLN